MVSEEQNATQEHPHRRLNILTNEWVLVSPHRAKRPWQGKTEDVAVSRLKSYEPACYLCPGNARTSGAVNPDYKGTYVFPNDFPAILDDPDVKFQEEESHFFRTERIRGVCKVIVYSPFHNKSSAELSIDEHRGVTRCWHDLYSHLQADFNYVQIFENKGAIMGCSNEHPHGQLWAHDHIPNEVEKELDSFTRYERRHSSNLLMDYMEEELRSNTRVVLCNEHWMVVVPFWAVWPFETLLMPRFPCSRFSDLNSEQLDSLAEMQSLLLRKYDNVFKVRFPYSFGWHSCPISYEGKFQLHAHFYPPLLRSATVKKFMVGYEMLAEPQRDITAESVATTLKSL